MSRAQTKAMRLVRDQKVNITWYDDVVIAATVQGDTNQYAVQIARTPEPRLSCECVWWTLRKSKCSHLLAVELEIQSQGVTL